MLPDSGIAGGEMTSLHQNIRKLAQSPGGLRLSMLKPNSLEIAKRMIESGELIKDGGVYRSNEVR